MDMNQFQWRVRVFYIIFIERGLSSIKRALNFLGITRGGWGWAVQKKTLLSIRPSVLSCLLIHFFFSSYFTLYFVNFSNSFTTNTSGPLRVITRSLPNKSWTWALYSWLQAMPYGVTACSCWFGGDVKASGTEIRWLNAVLIFIEALPDGSHTLNDRCITAFNVTRWCV